MRKAFEMADRVAQTDSTVLIQGESGTGKDLLASGNPRPIISSQQTLRRP